jgi:hypothetical protein
MDSARDAQLLADRQCRAVEALIGKARRALAQIRVAESAGEERLGLMLEHVRKAQAMAPSEEQLERLWALVAEGQARLDELCSSVRVRVSEEGAEALDSKALGQGGVL